MKFPKLAFLILLAFTLNAYKAQEEQQNNVQVLLDSAYSLYNKYNISCIEVARKALDLAGEKGDKLLIAKIHLLLGKCYKKHSLYSEAIDQLLEAKRIYTEIGFPSKTAAAFLQLGDAYRAIGNYSSAIEHMNEGLAIYSNFKDDEGAATAYNYLSSVYYEMLIHYHYNVISGKWKKNRDYYDEKKKKFISEAFYDTVMMYANMSMSLAKSHDLKIMEIANKNVIGVAYRFKDDMDRALPVLNEALKLSDQIGEYEYKAMILMNIAGIYEHFKDNRTAINYGLRALNIAKEKNIQMHIMLAARLLSNNYENVGDYKNALLYNKIAVDANNFINLESINAKIDFVQSKLQKEKEEEQLKARHIEILYMWIISGIVVFSITLITLILYRKNQHQKKINTVLVENNHIIESQNKELVESNATKDKFFAIISHDLRSPFTGLMGFTELFYEDYDMINDKERKEFVEKIKASVSSIYRLIVNLLDWSRLQNKNYVSKPKNIDLEQIIKDADELLLSSAYKKRIKIIIETANQNKVYADDNMMQTVVLNLMSNAIKFTRFGGTVKITVTEEKEFVKLSIIDSGIGISEENLENIFRIEFKSSEKGTAGERGSGLGLILCKEMIEKNNGRISISSELGDGTKVECLLPKAIPE
jgi:signal transduction histidine kinase